MQKNTFVLLAALFITHITLGQQPRKYASSDIYSAIQKLNFLGSALYIAAHPDDENTRLISYLSNDVKARTAYLSLTRGDGGQNLIGTELRELLGVLRTEELLAARRIDGGEQFFTRANDFGYSKHPDETLAIWNKDEVLADVVRAIRKFRPDIIINRFDHRSPGTTHGHHTASAMLSVEAFDIAGDASKYPGQLKDMAPWQPKRIFFNTSWWFYGSQEKFEKADKANLLKVETGNYYTQKGYSNNEIAALSRSQHRSQGFGSMGSRGTQAEYLEFLKGEFPKNKSDLFDGINTTWSRIENGNAIGDILYDVEKNFNFSNPSTHLPELLKAYQLIQQIEDEYWKTLKTKEITDIMEACTGLFLEAVADAAYTNPGGQVTVSVEAINRSKSNIKLQNVTSNLGRSVLSPDRMLKDNQSNTFKLNIDIPEKQPYTTPYWLINEGSLGMYRVDNEPQIGKPETPRALKVTFNLSFNENVSIPITKEVVYKYSEPDKGEIYRPFEILPPVGVSIANKVTLFSSTEGKEVPVHIKSYAKGLNGNISLKLPEGWQSIPKAIDFSIQNKNENKTVVFTILPPENEHVGSIKPIVNINTRQYNDELITIAYDHIPTQTVLLPSQAKIVRLNIEKAGNNIGYIAGAGDAIPESLQQIGYNVITIAPEAINAENLKRFDAIVVGIRAYNVVDDLKFKQHFLLDYVKNGGNIIVQYNTSGREMSSIQNLAPYRLDLSRDRVTDESSEVKILAKDHALVNFPNKITQKDFDGWVQERGLYFPDSWGPEFSPVLSMHDKGESPKKGSLLVAPYGKGHYIYTGLSFFRELPAGVPGAYKLFSNMISIGKEQVKQNDKKLKG